MQELSKKFAKGKVKRIEKQKAVRKMEEKVEEAQGEAKKIRKEKTRAQQRVLTLKQKLTANRMER